MFNLSDVLIDNDHDLTEITCPIITARKEIKGAYWYNDEPVISGGTIDGVQQCEMTYGDMCFYMTQRRMEVARFELSKPNLATCMTKLHKYDYAGKDYKYLYTRILETLPSRRLLRGALVKTYTLLQSLEDLITLYFIKNPGSMSMPPLGTFCPDKATFIPSELHVAVSLMVEFINNINVKSIVTKRTIITYNIEQPRPLKGQFPKIWDVDIMTADVAIKKIKDLVEHEMIVSEYLYKLEQYQAKVIGVLTDIQREIQHLSETMTSSQ